MSTTHNNGDDDKTLQADLQQLGHAYDQLEQVEPPALLDQAIVNRAHRAVETKTGWMQFGWLHALTTTAVVVLAVSLYLHQPGSTPVLQDNSGFSPPADLQARKPEVNQQQSAEKQRRSALPASQAMPAPSEAAKVSAGMSTETDTIPAPSELRLGNAEREFVTQAEPADEPVIMSDSAAEAVAIEEVLLESTENISTDQDRARTEKAALKAEQPAAPEIADTREKKADMESDELIRQQLQAIIELKQAGDSAWRTALQTFREQYPDYPIPEDLQP